jgi:hypothetical protein
MWDDYRDSVPSPYCGRVDLHDAHDTNHGRCPGPPGTEGASPCSWCHQPTKNEGPLCIECALELRQIDIERDKEWWRP